MLLIERKERGEVNEALPFYRLLNVMKINSMTHHRI